MSSSTTHTDDRLKSNPSFSRGHAQALVELDRYKILVESIEDYAIFMLDTNGYIISWNKGAQKAKGYTADEIIGHHFSDFYQEEDKKADKPTRELVLAVQQGRVEDEDWRVRKDGTKFWANVVITALYDNDGTHIGFAKVTRDLTERKHQEDKLRRANIQLKQQQRELERLNVSKDEFISLASHQLRTPATVIKQLLGLVTDGIYTDVPPPILNLIQKAYESNERQLNIVNSLLKVAQIDAGKVVLHRTKRDINQLVADLVEESRDTVSARDQTIIFKAFDGEPALAEIDGEYLRMAISNLVDNASKYTPSGGHVTVAVDQDTKHLYIHVTDNGVGIPPEGIKKLFTKFVRIPNEMSQTVGGSGLGLYWLHKVVELHGGDVDIQSEVGVGTTFTIALPRPLE